MAIRPRSPPEQVIDAERFTLRQGAKALVTSAAKVLLVREQHADGSPFWTLPGGGVQVHEDPIEALHRELDEELNCRAAVAGPVSQFWYSHESLANTVSQYTVFDCALLSDPAPNPDEGIFETRWACPDSLPPETLPQIRHVCRQVVDLPTRASVSDD